MPAKKSRRTYKAKGSRSRTKGSKSKPKRKKSLPIKAFQLSIGKKFQIKESQVVDDKKSKAKGRREGL